ncbi:MAG: family 78 glycoside hydrolase catalytic domain [Thermoguttaceae bacterium]|nr:family 78 glycoside hydrolase catalytic domain [Thermoguttaceae bacterium]
MRSCPRLPVFIPVLLLLFAPAGWATTARNLRCEYFRSPRGVDIRQPRLSWQADSADKSAVQAAYRITVAKTAEALAGGSLVWDSGWIETDGSAQVTYAGEPLQSDTDYFWQVELRDAEGKVSPPEEIGFWSTGLLDKGDWSAQWIQNGSLPENEVCAPGPPQNPQYSADPYFRKSFTLAAKPKRATLFLASIGYHELYVNGARVGDGVLAPNVSQLAKRALYIAYPIEEYLHEGENTIAVWLGTGWSVFEYYQTENKPCRPLFLAQTDIALEDGTTERIATDDSWLTAASGNYLIGAWCFAQFGGERQEPAKMIADWNLPPSRFTRTEAWSNASTVDLDLALSAQICYPNRKQEPIYPVAVEKIDDGTWRIDMGRNFAGWTQLSAEGQPGSTLEFRWSESLLHEMTFRNFNQLVLDGNGKGQFQSHFNYSSGRWITCRGLTAPPSEITGWTVRTDYPKASSFECSDELINWLYQTVLRTYENLTLGGYVVDCPQRERCGYGGDAHATSETGMYNYDLAGFYYAWMQSWRDVQGWHPDWIDSGPQPVEGKKDDALAGLLPNTAPTYFGAGGPAWGGIVITLPWLLYLQYGDRRVLEENFSMMEKWIGYLNAFTREGLLYPNANFLGDWLWPGVGEYDVHWPYIVCLNNLYRIFNLATAAKIARVLGRDDRAEEWEKLADEGREAINSRWYHDEDGSYGEGQMALEAAALLADVPRPDQRDRVMKRLEEEILVNNNGHIGAGITGGALLFRFLRLAGRDDLIWPMISKTDYPSYGFMRANDATTLWEAWELNRPGHSLLHSSYLFPGAWFIDSCLGIRPTEADPGFRTIQVRPPKVEATPLTWARGHYDAPTGTVRVSWEKSADRFLLHVEFPPNTKGEIFVPAADADQVAIPEGARHLRDENGYAVFAVPGGQWFFQSSLP